MKFNKQFNFNSTTTLRNTPTVKKLRQHSSFLSTYNYTMAWLKSYFEKTSSKHHVNEENYMSFIDKNVN